MPRANISASTLTTQFQGGGGSKKEGLIPSIRLNTFSRKVIRQRTNYCNCNLYKNIIVIVNGRLVRVRVPNNCELVCTNLRLPQLGGDDVVVRACNMVCEGNRLPGDFIHTE